MRCREFVTDKIGRADVRTAVPKKIEEFSHDSNMKKDNGRCQLVFNMEHRTEGYMIMKAELIFNSKRAEKESCHE